MTSSPVSPRPVRRRRRLLLVVVLLLLSAGLGVFLWGRYHWTAAQKAERRHRLAEAARHLDACLTLWPRNRELHLLAARVARRRDDYAAAERHLEMCEPSGSADMAVALESILLRVQQGHLRDTEDALRSRVENGDADSPLILEALAKGYAHALRTEQALDSLTLLLEMGPDHIPALLLRGRLLEGQRRDDDARQDYQRALDLDPGLAVARLRLADCLARLGEVRRAVAHYEYLRARPPVAPEVIVGLARCRHDLHQLAEAEKLLRDLLSDHPDHLAARVEWGRVVVRAGRPAEAEEALRDAAVAAPYDREAHLALYLCLDAQGKKDEAGRSLARVRQLEDDLMRVIVLSDGLAAMDEPEELASRCEIGAILLRTGREGEGLRWLASVLERDPSHPEANRALADHYDRTGKPEAAARHRRAAARAGADRTTGGVP